MTGTDSAVLEPERIERMKADVMTAIADHERSEAARRGRRRTRQVLGGAAAAAVVIVGFGLGNGLSGTGGSDSGVGAAIPPNAAGGLPGRTMSEIARDAAEDVDSSAPGSTTTVITTGSIAVEVDDVDAAVTAIRDFAQTNEGRIDGENFEEGSRPRADLTVRIRADLVDDLRSTLTGVGEVHSVNLDRTDVAAEVADVAARIESLEASIRRLRAIIADSDTTKDLLDAETQLTQRQADLESLQAQQRVLRDRTSLATIHVAVTSTESTRSVEPSGFFGGLTRGWNALADATNAVVTGTGVLVPWLLPLGGVAVIVLVVRRVRRR